MGMGFYKNYRQCWWWWQLLYKLFVFVGRAGVACCCIYYIVQQEIEVAARQMVVQVVRMVVDYSYLFYLFSHLFDSRFAILFLKP